MVDREPTSDWNDPPVSDAERQRFVDLLTFHVGTGRLTLAAFEVRLEQVLSATRLSDLYRACRDLPFPAHGEGPR